MQTNFFEVEGYVHKSTEVYYIRSKGKCYQHKGYLPDTLENQELANPYYGKAIGEFDPVPVTTHSFWRDLNGVVHLEFQWKEESIPIEEEDLNYILRQKKVIHRLEEIERKFNYIKSMVSDFSRLIKDEDDE